MCSMLSMKEKHVPRTVWSSKPECKTKCYLANVLRKYVSTFSKFCSKDVMEMIRQFQPSQLNSCVVYAKLSYILEAFRPSSISCFNENRIGKWKKLKHKWQFTVNNILKNLIAILPLFHVFV